MKRNKIIMGWREWVAFPDLGISAIKAKVDTGARTSALHAQDIRYVRRGNTTTVHFTVHPIQRKTKPAVSTSAVLIDERTVLSSTGHRQLRPVIETQLEMNGELWPVELTLTSRDVMGFRMLLGRQAIRRRGIVDPSKSFLTRKAPKQKNQRKKKS